MFGNALQGWHLVIILALVLLLFGAQKLPALAKSIGQSLRIFRNEMPGMTPDDNVAESNQDSSAQTPTNLR